MNLKRKIFTCLLALCLCFTPIVLSGCIGGNDNPGGDGGDGGDGGETEIDVSDYIQGLSTAYIEDASVVNEEIVAKYKELGDKILTVLANTYGANGLDINTSSRVYTNAEGENQPIMYNETLKNSMAQDEWEWGNTETNVFSTSHKNLFIQNMFEATLGLNISNSYLSSSLETYASKVDHKGFFYYEADAIAEYILNYIIGDSVVAEDNEKFHDVNNNGTFDYYYTITNFENRERFQVLNIISDFDNTNTRAQGSTKSAEWNKINFGETDFSTWANVGGEVAYNDSGLHVSYFIDGQYDFNGAVHLGNWIVDHRYDQAELLEMQLQDLSSTKFWDKRYYVENEIMLDAEGVEGYVLFSCFKNYVNTVYYIVYSAVEELNWELASKATSSLSSINDYGLNLEGDDSFTAEYKNYKSTTILAKTNCSMDAIAMAFELDPSITESISISLIANYVRTVNGEQVATKAKLGDVTVHPGTINVDGTQGAIEMYDLTLAEPDEYGVHNTEFYALGITQFDLKAVNLLSLGSYTLQPSTSFIGSSTEFSDPTNDYVEISFVINTDGYSDAKFKFAFMTINVE